MTQNILGYTQKLPELAPISDARRTTSGFQCPLRATSGHRSTPYKPPDDSDHDPQYQSTAHPSPAHPSPPAHPIDMSSPISIPSSSESHTDIMMSAGLYVPIHRRTPSASSRASSPSSSTRALSPSPSTRTSPHSLWHRVSDADVTHRLDTRGIQPRRTPLPLAFPARRPALYSTSRRGTGSRTRDRADAETAQGVGVVCASTQSDTRTSTGSVARVTDNIRVVIGRRQSGVVAENVMVI